MTIRSTFADRLTLGLKRSSIKTPAKWAREYRVMGKPFPGKWDFSHHPWLLEMHDSIAILNVGQKAAQMGYSETVINWTFAKIDLEGESALYILPTADDASDFSASRFDPALELSPHLSSLFSDVKNVGLKRAGSASFFLRGSKSKSKLKSVPVALIIFDEVDEMDQANIPLAMERTSGQPQKNIWMISTATAEGFGINKYFQPTTAETYFFKCPSCSKLITLEFPRNLTIGTDNPLDPALNKLRYHCHLCKAELNHTKKPDLLKSKFDLSGGVDGTGIWVPANTSVDPEDARGFYIPQLFSCTISPKEMAQSAIKSKTNPLEEQEFYNSKLGLPYTPKGAKISDQDFEECTGEFLKYSKDDSRSVITMGVDVGTWLHITIEQWTVGELKSIDISDSAKPKLLFEGKVKEFEELDKFMSTYGIVFCVIDANPERRKATEFASRFYGKVRVCFYGRGCTGKLMKLGTDEPTITVNRTSWLDLSLGRFHNRTISLPKDLSLEYKENLKALVRILKKDADGNPVGRYINSDADHFAHSRNYSEIAFPLAIGTGQTEDVTGDVL